MSETGRLIWLDALRLVAGLSMVGLHATADPSGQPWPDYPVSDRIAPVLLRSVLYVARTELFLMISVFLLMLALDRRPRGYAAVMMEQSRRLLVPFVFWTFFFAAYGLIKASQFGYLDAAWRDITQPSNWFSYLLLGNVKYHMHFIPTLFGILLFYPLYLLSVHFPVLGVGVLICLLVKSELDAFVFPTLWGTDALPYAVRAVKVLTYVGYGMVAGAAYGIFRNASPQTLQAWVKPLLFFGGLLFLVKLVASHKTIVSGVYPFGYTAGFWADFLMPVVLFLICMCLGALAWPKVLSRLAPYSFGIYLCHPIFLDLAEIGLRGSSMTPIAQVLTKIALVVPATCLFVVGLKRIRPIAWSIGLGPFPAVRRRPIETVESS